MIRQQRTVLGFGSILFLTLAVTSCGSTAENPAEESVSSTSTPTDDSSTSDQSSNEVGIDETSTTEVPRGLQLDKLPGRIAVNSIGCSNDIFSNMNSICIYDPDGSDLVQVEVPGDYVDFLTWTWDSTKLLFDNGDASWSVDADGNGLVQRDPYQIPMSTQSPDGRWSIGTLMGENGFWLSPAGSPRDDRQWQQITSDPDECCEFARWSTDSRRLLYSMGFGPGVCGGLSSTDVQTKAVQVIIAAGSMVAGEPVCATTESGRWSPDGTKVLFLDEGPDLDITVARPMLVNADGTGLRPLIPENLASDTSVLPTGWFATAVAWSPDGTAIAMSIVHDMGSALYIVSVDGTEIIEVGALPVGALPMDSMSWAPGL